MAREDNVAIVESFLNGIASNQIDRLPVHPDFTVESPLVPRSSGAAAMEYARRLASAVKSIRIIQHIVEGDDVATMFEEDTIHGPLLVFSKFVLESGRIKDVRVFYDPSNITAST